MRKMYFRRAHLFRNEKLNVGKAKIMYAGDVSVFERRTLTFTLERSISVTTRLLEASDALSHFSSRKRKNDNGIAGAM